MIRINGHGHNYAWGKLGRESEVARLLALGTGIDIDETKPYAELWMGTHSKGPSTVVDKETVLLSSHLARNKGILGKKLQSALVEQNGRIQLPFLFKVLSVNQALSVQVHPSKSEAKVLHEKDPKNYPDDNHKPEMAIALTNFELLCGFRPFAQIIGHIEGIPCLKQLLEIEAVESLRMLVAGSSEEKANLRTIFTSLMKSKPEKVKSALDSLEKELKSSPVGPATSSLIRRLLKQYPGDIGCFAPLFLNYFTLLPFEATFLGPNEPHAYLSGDCIECMACSDNTVRAGLTPKFVDVDNLCKMLTYRCAGPEANKFASKVDPKNPHIRLYEPPVPDFAVRSIQGLDDGQEYRVPPLGTCSIILVQSGAADLGDRSVSAGDIFFIPADLSTCFTVKNRPVVLFQAYCCESKVDQLIKQR